MHYTYTDLENIVTQTSLNYISDGYKEDATNQFRLRCGHYKDVELVKDSSRVIISLIRSEHHFDDSPIGYPCIDLVIKDSRNYDTASIVMRFYLISGQFYTTDCDEINQIKLTRLKRFMHHKQGSFTVTMLHCGDMSIKLRAYISKKVASIMEESHRTDNFIITSAYFMYSNNNRQFVVTIRHADSQSTECVYLSL